MISRRINLIDKKIKYMLMAFISTFAVCAQYIVAENEDINAYAVSSATSMSDNCITNFLLKMQHSFSGNGFAELIILISLFLFYKKTWENVKRNLSAIILAIACAMAYIIGKSYALTGTDALILSNKYQIIFSISCFIGLVFLLICVFGVLLYALDEISETDYNKEKCTKRGVYALIIFLSWLPYMVAYYPGNIPFDTFGQLNQYLGLTSLSNHFPVVSTFILGGGYSLGKVFGNNIGLFLYTVIQALIGAVAFSEVCVRIARLAIPKAILYATLVFYCVVPIWATSASGIVKDYTYYPIMLMYVLTYVDIVKEQQVGDWKRILKYIIWAVMATFFRNDAIYVVLLSSLFLIFLLKKKEKIKIVAISLMLLLFNGCYMNYLNTKGYIQEFDKREAYSVMFQQTARYIQYYEDELTQEEKEIINQTLDYEIIKKSYMPGLSDPVKETYRCPDEEVWNSYKKVWFSCFLKHPKVYLDSFITGCYGYLLPGYNFTSKETYFLYNVFDKFEPEGLGISYFWNDNVRSVFESYANVWKNAPILSLLISAGTYSWVMLLCIVALIRKSKVKECIAFMPYVLIFCVCCVSPVTGLLRYAIPYIAGTPLMICYVLECLKKDKISENKKELSAK